ncbi:MAG TPA: SGNH/GDSL hydrolase family protein [Candidatus Brocadiia bacterium]|nr:SGNH/GDSL hydrolase family protein [Candidatus Brocadiia bacterium]
MSEPRNPLAALRRKAEKGQDVTVAFFGGSITWGGNSSDIETRSYRALAGDWFRRRLKGVKVRCVNGGYGGTGSVAGAYRFEEHALSHGPDLVFVEFAINDSSTPQATMQAAHEAIFRKAWRSNPQMGIVLLISGSRLDTQAELVTRRIAGDFGLHVVDVGAHKRRLIQSGRATNDDLWVDGVHPTD